MPKKHRNRGRKKGLRSEGDDENCNDAVDVDVDVLSENYTVAESLCSTLMDESLAESFSEFEEESNNIEEWAGSEEATLTTNRHNKLIESLSLASSMATERRGNKREHNLLNLFKAITQYATGDNGCVTVSSRLDDVIIPACTTGLRGGVASPSEQYAACRVLEATSILTASEEFSESIYDPLVKVIKATGRAPQVRGAALRALSIAHFICDSDFFNTETVLDLCECVFAPRYRGEDVATSLRATALDCWALLSTTAHDEYVAGDETITGSGRGRGLIILSLLNDCLNHDNPMLRCAAGETLSLIHEARLNLGIDNSVGGNASERRFARGSWEGSDEEVIMDEVKQRIAELSVESGHHMGKKLKKEQRALFREYMATIVEDESPSEIVSLRGGQLTLNTWREIIQLKFIRHCLQGGFQIQLMTNKTLQMVFGVDGSVLNANRNMSQLEKRLTLSKTSDSAKAIDLERAKRRKSKIAASMKILYD